MPLCNHHVSLTLTLTLILILGGDAADESPDSKKRRKARERQANRRKRELDGCNGDEQLVKDLLASRKIARQGRRNYTHRERTQTR